ncbi:hypothetical protein HZU40_13290 [Mycolicibacterium fluoranthenivorans]|jgi:hypothetical protein|uniref:MmpS3 protein n=1 Tax=Mycolicibacterium fluoranthenivorans TaxID=258505 RepID=A0A7G8PLA5_9MYCO|nr:MULTISPECIES: hypothetical protein [Mycobacteriaceae]MCV7251986.1 hypothetical protein [Mycobacterium hackensackense]QNJ95121.1 hypothetical protein HZU40_13290 [Mycolicibacterium fluoranthenivorans]
MSRPYSRNSATRDAGYRSRYSDDSYEYDDADTGAEYAEYDGAEYEYEFPADYHDQLDRRWIWVAGVAGVILMVAVICTGVILGGGDSGSVSATQASTSAAQATTSAPATTSASAPAPLPAQQQIPALPAETVTTVTPTPTATAAPPTAETPVAPAAAPAVDPAAARTITYKVDGQRQMLDLVTIIYTDQQGALQTDVNAALPWTKTVTLDPGVQLSSVTATSIGAQLNCAITDAAGTPLVAQTNNTIIATCTK